MCRLKLLEWLVCSSTDKVGGGDESVELEDEVMSVVLMCCSIVI